MSLNDSVVYEHCNVTVKRDYADLYSDNYQNFGWETETTSVAQKKRHTVTIKFRRDRKIRNKMELTRLQKNFDACIFQIDVLEKSKKATARGAAISVGVIGTAFVAGSVFSVIAGMITLCIVLEAMAFICWILPCFLYIQVFKRKTKKVEPLIEAKYDELHMVCDKGYRLLNNVKEP